MQKAYAPYFHLELDAFGETPDVRFFFESSTHCRVLEQLANAMRTGQGFSLLTGEIGTGKTLLTRLLLQIFEADTDSAMVLFPRCSEAELLRSICEELEIPNLAPFDAASSKQDLTALNEFLLANAARGRRTLVVIDEAQNLPRETLEAVRLLSNLESNDRKLLQILLVAQPEFLVQLAEPELRQLCQRIGTATYLEALSATETSSYVRYRLERSGGANFVRFDTAALSGLHALTRGLPRDINRRAHELLEYCFERKIRLVSGKVFQEWRQGRRARGRWKFWQRRGVEIA